MISAVLNNYPADFLRIEYMLGNICNYKCSYCFPGSNEGDALWPDINITKRNLAHLLRHYQQYGKNKFQFYLVGGEPTMWKELPELAEFLKKEFDAVLNISTNASPSLNWWNRNLKNYDYIEISVHHKFADVEHIKSVADLLYANDVNVVANVLMDPDHFETCQSIVKQLSIDSKPWPIIAKAVLYNGTTRYTDEQKQYFVQQTKRAYDPTWYQKVSREPVVGKRIWIKDLSENFVEIPNDSWFAMKDANHFQGWQCNLGVDFLAVHKDGTITGNCRQHLWNRIIYFNLYDQFFTQEFNPSIEPTVCHQKICTCSSEVTIKKRNASV